MVNAGYDYLIERKHIPWRPYRPDDPRPLNRHVRHDSRSKAYAYPERDLAALVKVDWADHIGVLDQGDTGSCTGNAATGALGTTPFWETLSAKLVSLLNEAYARDVLYHLATTYDSFDGTYPPTDTGSDGLSVAKAAQSQGLIAGYQHALSLNAALAALQHGPVITGVDWTDGFDNPTVTGVVRVSGNTRGGHEFVVVAYGTAADFDLTAADFGLTTNPADIQIVKARNSWGTSFGVGGYFFFTTDDWQTLLSRQGDVTIFTPLNQPAPVPTPTPVPSDDPTALAMVITGNVWERTILSRLTKAGRFRSAFDAWKAAHGW